MVKQEIRVRMAPSPTGLLHIGTARTALFNWLFAKKNNGKFVVRIEDTDQERSSREYEKNILESLDWLGLKWDEGIILSPNEEKQTDKQKGEYRPYRQSERTDIYEKYIQKLLDEKLAYYCFCTKEELESERQGLLSQGLAPKYTGKCRNLSEQDTQEKLNSGLQSVIRFKIQDSEISFSDIIRGKISFDMSLIGDIVIARDKRSPLYNLASIIDDYEMKISHVIRGEDLLPSTPKQISLQRALKFTAMKYAHLPLILSSKKGKMSKRFDTVAISEYKNSGYLPESLVNFMALIGWHPEPETDPTTGKIHEREILSLNELIDKFDLSRVQKGGAYFDTQKLEWINGQYIKEMDDKDIFQRLKIAIQLPDDLTESKLIKIIGVVKERMKKLTDFNELADFFMAIADYNPEMLQWKDVRDEITIQNLKELARIFESKDPKNFTIDKLEDVVNELAGEKGRGEIFWPLRVALSGKESSPGPIQIMEILGKKESLKRINIAIQKLESRKQQIL